MNKVLKFLGVFMFLICLSSCTSDLPDEPPVDDHNPPIVEEKINVWFIDEVSEEVLKTIEIKKGDSITEYPDIDIEGYYYYWDKTIAELTNLEKDTKVMGNKLEYYLNAKYYIDDVLFFEKNTTYFSNYELPSVSSDYESHTWKVVKKEIEGEICYIEYNLEYTLRSVYNITYKDGEEILSLVPNTYNVEDVTELPVYEKEGYYFVGWFISDISLTNYQVLDNIRGDLVLQARFIELEKKDVIEMFDTPYHFESISKKPHTTGKGYVYQPVFPSGVNSTVTEYDWSTSDKTVASVSVYSSISVINGGYCVLTAKSKTDKSLVINCVIKVSASGISVGTLEEANTVTTHNVTFVGMNNEVISQQVVVNGSFAYPPTPLEYDGYAFIGWDHDTFNITSDLTIKAKYQKGVNNYSGKTFSIIGDSISTFQNYIPEDYSYFYPWPTGDIFDVNQTWWMQVINGLGGELFINNSFSGSCVAAGGTSSSNNITRLEKLVVSNQYADVTIIYMGSNDCNSGSGVSATQFKKQYDEMITKIMGLCKNTEIVLCTLPKSELYPENRRMEFNDIIEELANKYSLKVVLLDDVDLVPHLLDSAHPFLSGMDVVAEKIKEEMLK